MKDLEFGKRLAASEILNYIEQVCFSEEFREHRINYGTRGQQDLIIKFIKENYLQ